MASITLSVSEEFKSKLKWLDLGNLSEGGREETIKKLIFEQYLRTGDVSDKAWEFCEKIDWHPVDELPYKEEFLKKIKKIKKEKPIRLSSIDEIFKNIK